MGLDTLVRSGVALANRLTDALQVDVTHEAYSTQSTSGEPTYATGVTRSAIVEPKARSFMQPNGSEQVSEARVLLLGNVAVDQRDRFTLPGSVTGPVLAVSGFADPLGGSYYTEVWIGRATG